MLGSHNSLTFGDTKWYLRLFNIWAKCQSNTIVKQSINGCRYFDLRFKIVGDSKLQVAHGSVNYDIDLYYILGWLNTVANSEPVYVRVTMEYNSPQPIETEIKFKQIMTTILQTYSNITYCGIYYKYTLNEAHNLIGEVDKDNQINLVPSKLKKIKTVDKYSSVTGWKQIFLFPWLYAKLNNKKFIKQYNEVIEDSESVLLLDFI